jgi:hypothetical protein
MDTSIYIGPVLQLFPLTVNVWGDAPLRQKMMEEISSQVCIVSRRYLFKPLNVINIQLTRVYISKEMTDLRECIPYPVWQQIMIS